MLLSVPNQAATLVGGEVAEEEGSARLSKAQKKNMRRLERKALQRAAADTSVASSEVRAPAPPCAFPPACLRPPVATNAQPGVPPACLRSLVMLNVKPWLCLHFGRLPALIKGTSVRRCACHMLC